MREYETFHEFYPFYLTQHRKPWTRLLHVIGTSVAIAWAAYCLTKGNYPEILIGFVLAYGPAWASHFFIEKNRPATFRYPIYSLVSDFKFIYELATGKQTLGF